MIRIHVHYILKRQFIQQQYAKMHKKLSLVKRLHLLTLDIYTEEWSDIIYHCRQRL